MQPSRVAATVWWWPARKPERDAIARLRVPPAAFRQAIGGKHRKLPAICRSSTPCTRQCRSTSPSRGSSAMRVASRRCPVPCTCRQIVVGQPPVRFEVPVADARDLFAGQRCHVAEGVAIQRSEPPVDTGLELPERVDIVAQRDPAERVGCLLEVADPLDMVAGHGGRRGQLAHPRVGDVAHAKTDTQCQPCDALRIRRARCACGDRHICENKGARPPPCSWSYGCVTRSGEEDRCGPAGCSRRRARACAC